MPIAVSDAVERLVKNRVSREAAPPLSASAAEVMGNPLNSLAWLANALGKMGGREG